MELPNYICLLADLDIQTPTVRNGFKIWSGVLNGNWSLVALVKFNWVLQSTVVYHFIENMLVYLIREYVILIYFTEEELMLLLPLLVLALM